MKKLIIVESPAKIKTISKFLNKDFIVMSTMGHIKDLPTKNLGVSLDEKAITINYVPLEGKEQVIANICKQASTSDIIYVAPDPDREGEIIGWHIAQEIAKVAKKNSKIYRISFNELTQTAVIDAIEHPGDINMQLVEAQQARRIMDRWVGYEVSPILWKKITKGLSAGRVQSVALRMICDREQAIRSFKPEEFWSITGNFTSEKAVIPAPLVAIGRNKADIKTEKEALKITEEALKENYIIDSIVDKTRVRNALPPFMTSTLQQAAYNILGFPVKKTMTIAQRLYEGIPLSDPNTPIALITYMRTDSLRIADSALQQAREYIVKEYPSEYLPTKANAFEKKTKTKTQDAHEAIRPIDCAMSPEKIGHYLPSDESKLYNLIWKRFIACQMKPAEYAQRQVTIKGGKYTFKVTGSTLIFDGFLRVYQEDEENEKEDKVILPSHLKEKHPLTIKKVDPKQHFTQPPSRFTEASLVKELEKEGIGRPSTYATILNTIRARSYTTLEKKRFIPTELGMVVTEMLVKNLPAIMNPKFTALMEEDLDKIAEGEVDRDTLLRNFYSAFSKDLITFGGKSAEGKKSIETDIQCPECKKGVLTIRFGKAGEFLGCANYPECSFTSNFIRNEQGNIELKEGEGPQLLDKTCPTCGKQLRQMRGKFGDFISCSGYPECKYIERKKFPFACPQCSKDIIERAWRGGKFWGCSGYPQCKLAIFDPIEETKCPQCSWPFLTKKTDKEGNTTLICANKECGYKS